MGRVSVNRKPVTIRGVTYASRMAAARALGVNPATITQAERKGYLDCVGLRKQLGILTGGRMGESITIRGVTYPSHTAAAAALSVSVSRISTAKREGSLERVGLRATGRGYRRTKNGRMQCLPSKEGRK